MTTPITTELLRKYDRPGPRYTSYPTAVEFSDTFDAQRYGEKLLEVNAAGAEPLSLYMHIPFCQARSRFFARHVHIPRQRRRPQPSPARRREKRLATRVRPVPSRCMLLLPFVLCLRRRGGPLPPDRLHDRVARRRLLPAELR